MFEITVTLSNEEYEELSEVCKTEGISINDFAQRSIQRTLSISKFRKLRAATLPFAKRVGVVSDSDVFDLMKDKKS
ncbi:MAG TPA: hypothetical protein PLD62_06220 [Candidatus Cloacimonadota bacterium]|nr:hypothetical protein [Candidatus Cloacimonadota bacterium]